MHVLYLLIIHIFLPWVGSQTSFTHSDALMMFNIKYHVYLDLPFMMLICVTPFLITLGCTLQRYFETFGLTFLVRWLPSFIALLTTHMSSIVTCHILWIAPNMPIIKLLDVRTSLSILMTLQMSFFLRVIGVLLGFLIIMRMMMMMILRMMRLDRVMCLNLLVIPWLLLMHLVQPNIEDLLLLTWSHIYNRSLLNLLR